MHMDHAGGCKSVLAQRCRRTRSPARHVAKDARCPCCNAGLSCPSFCSNSSAVLQALYLLYMHHVSLLSQQCPVLLYAHLLYNWLLSDQLQAHDSHHQGGSMLKTQIMQQYFGRNFSNLLDASRP